MGKDDDNAEMGPYGRFSKCFITYRGVRMGVDMDDENWFDKYKEKVGCMIKLPTITTTT